MSSTPTLSSFANRFLMSPRQQQFRTPSLRDSHPQPRRVQSTPSFDEGVKPGVPGSGTEDSLLKIVVHDVDSEPPTPAFVIQTDPEGTQDLPPPNQRHSPEPEDLSSSETAAAQPSATVIPAMSSAKVASSPSSSASALFRKKTINSKTLDPLYPTLINLPCSFVGSKYSHRQSDGGTNNVLYPEIGRAGMPYARNVPSEHQFAALPEPGLVFDTLLKARDKRVHPSGASSLTYAFAQLVTYSLYNTNFDDWDINLTSSYLDLSPLYGSDDVSQKQIRDKESGRGLLYPDTFAEDRLTFATPAMIALLVIFSRNHNYIAERLLSINERKIWKDPPPMDETFRAKQDEEIFQTARLINSGHFLSVMISDHLPAYLGLSDDGNWTRSGGIDLSQLRKQAAKERSHGAHSSVEFSLLYRWHASVSQADLKWTEEQFNQLFKRKSFDRVTSDELERAVRENQSTLNDEPRKRSFARLSRGLDGRFDDDELVSVFLEAAESPAGAFRARGIAAVFRSAEILAIEQSRSWGVCSLNEFRAHLGLKPFATFEEWCSDPVISSTARRLYSQIDNLELYPGLQCEASSDSPYSCGYTMTKALLADAVRLIQADRFYTTEFNPRGLTSWGYLDCQRDISSSMNSGGQLSKLLSRHLRRYYPYNSVYGCFPFSTPQSMKDTLTRQGIADRYLFGRPTAALVPKILDEFTSIKHVISDAKIFPPMYEFKITQDSQEFMLSIESGIECKAPDKYWVLEILFPNKDALQNHGEWFRESMMRKIKERAWKYGGIKGTTIDIVHDVINAASVEWVAEHLFGITLKTDAFPEGLFTESELYDILSKLYSLKYPSIEDTDNGFILRQSVRPSHVILGLVAKEILALKPVLSPRAFMERFFPGQKIAEDDVQPSYELFNALASSNKPLEELITIVLDIAVSCSVSVAQAAVHAVEFYLEGEQERERHHILELLQLDDAESGEVLLGYAREALRFNPRISNVWREVTADAQIPQGQDMSPLNVHAGDRLWISFKNANLDPAQFPEPVEIDPRRQRTSYRILGNEFFSGPIAAFGEQIIVEALRVVLRLKNLRRAEGALGRMSGFRTVVHETELNVYLMPNGSTSCWPGPLHLVYDD
ncbi:hypothetical protein APHAL10511_008259 [Amanita phalloides]|nr:hypothetical protein APHAL10511_008259 [Amanita phalloides]